MQASSWIWLEMIIMQRLAMARNGRPFRSGALHRFPGGDHYTSTGPIYNGGSAWDRSVALFIDGGSQADFYHSFGLGHADQGSWSLSIEEGGLDHYLSSQDFGVASDNSMAGFFDLSGEDEYAGSSRDLKNTVMLLDAKGGLFLDR